MGFELRRRDVLRTAGAVGLGTVAASAAGVSAGALPARAEGAGGRGQAYGTELTVTKEPFGSLGGQPVERYTMTGGGIRVRMLTYGATIQTIEVPDRFGRYDNVCLGLATLDEYVAKSPYFGATIGRYANRIGGASFVLDGKRYTIPANDGKNALHGGTKGFDKYVWDATEVHDHDRAGVRFTHVSPDGDMGFPGMLSVSATYTVDRRGELRVDYHATTDAPTVLNLTNHAYLNLAGEGRDAVYRHELWLDADRITPVDQTLIPTGELRPVAGTPFDFRRPKPLGRDIRDGYDQVQIARGIDHNFVLNGSSTPGSPRWFARLAEPTTGRTLTMATDQPGVQVYTANFLDGTLVGTGGRSYRQGDSVSLETQHFPDSPNQPSFPSTVLRPGQAYDSTTAWRFGVA